MVIKFIQLFYDGYETFICCDGVNVVSILSKENGMKSESITLLEAQTYRFPLLILGSDIDILIGTSDKGEDISAFVPSGIGDTIELEKKALLLDAGLEVKRKDDGFTIRGASPTLELLRSHHEEFRSIIQPQYPQRFNCNPTTFFR